jgi:acyl-CoA thioesterase FadM
MVQGLIHLVTVDHDQRLVKLPESVRAAFISV